MYESVGHVGQTQHVDTREYSQDLATSRQRYDDISTGDRANWCRGTPKLEIAMLGLL